MRITKKIKDQTPISPAWLVCVEVKSLARKETTGFGENLFRKICHSGNIVYTRADFWKVNFFKV